MTYIVCNDIKLYYERTGKGPELVLLHGFGCDLRLWEPLIPRLKNDLTVTAFDMRGSGKSDKPTEPYSIETLRNDAASFIEAVCKGPVSVLGFSMGGMVAMDLAATRPELVERLILVSTLPAWDCPFPPPAKTRELFRRTDVSPELLTEVYETIFGSAYKKKVSAREYVDFRMSDENPQSLDDYLLQLRALEASDVREKVRLITVPALMIVGGEDKVAPPGNSVWLKENIHNAELKVLEGSGHMLPIEMPERLAEKIKEVMR